MRDTNTAFTIPLLHRVMMFESLGRVASSSTGFKNEEDGILLEKFNTGTSAEREEAFVVIFNRYDDQIQTNLRIRGIPDDEVQELRSHVWEIFINVLPNFEWRGIPFSHFLLSTTKKSADEYFRKLEENHCIQLDEEINSLALSYLDKALHEVDVSSNLETPHPQVQKQAGKLFAQYTAPLKPQEKTVLRLIFYKGLNSSQIANQLHLKPGTVRQIHRRAIDKLRREWGGENT